jgi:hypothetical protein
MGRTDQENEQTAPVSLGELDAWNSSAQIGQEGLRKREVALDQVGPESAGTGPQAGIARFRKTRGGQWGDMGGGSTNPENCSC